MFVCRVSPKSKTEWDLSFYGARRTFAPGRHTPLRREHGIIASRYPLALQRSGRTFRTERDQKPAADPETGQRTAPARAGSCSQAACGNLPDDRFLRSSPCASWRVPRCNTSAAGIYCEKNPKLTSCFGYRNWQCQLGHAKRNNG